MAFYKNSDITGIMHFNQDGAICSLNGWMDFMACQPLGYFMLISKGIVGSVWLLSAEVSTSVESMKVQE